MKTLYTIFFASLFSLLNLTSVSAQSSDSVVLIDLKGPIGPVMEEFIVGGIKKAQERKAALIVIQMDTPGGLATSMRTIIQAILDSNVPVATYVSPSGARATSAGAFILYASHIAAMAPATHVGSASPVAVGGSMPDQEGESPGMNEKVLNDSIAYIESLADLRGRNKEWAKKFVSKAASIPYKQALKERVIDVVAEDLDDLLAQIDGRTVQVKDASVKLSLQGANVETVEENWRTQFLKIITNPNIAYFLLLIGIYALIYEFTHPGLLIPGVTGAICLIVGLYALSLLPINYAGLALIILGLAFLAAEAFYPSFGVLGLGGVIAFVVGSILLIDSTAPAFQISRALIAGMAVVTGGVVFLIVNLVVRSMSLKGSTGEHALINKTAEVLAWSGHQGKVKIQGEMWKAQSTHEIKKGQHVKVTHIQGLTLIVEPLKQGDI